MVRKSVSRLLTLSLLSCLALSVFGIDAGVLGISWNVQLATEPTDNPRHKHSWMSIVEFDKNVVDIFSDEEIVGLARRAFDDMKADYGRNDPPWKDPKNNIGADQPKDAPAAMSAIAIGQQLFLSSSVRGGGLGYTPSAFTKVREALIQCQMETGGNTKHLTLAGCGEPMAAHIALQSGLGSLNGAKVVTWGEMRKNKKIIKIGVMKPCGLFDENGAVKDRWGCNAFTRDLGLIVIPEDTEARDKDYTPNPRILPICI